MRVTAAGDRARPFDWFSPRAARVAEKIRSDANLRRRGLLALPGAYALLAALYQMYAERGTNLDPDVLTYLALARSFTLQSFVGGFREPIWPALLAIPVQLIGPHWTLIRLVGIAGYLLMVVAFQLVTRRLFGATWSTVASIAFAASPWLMFQAPRGLREETAAGLLLLFALAALRPRWGWRRGTALFAFAAVIAMLRWDTLLLTLPVLAIGFILYRPNVIAWLAGPAAAALIVAPLLVGNYQHTGDPMYHSNIHSIFYRNQEFRDQPGYPPTAEVEKNAYAGPKETWFHYLFGLHSPFTLAQRGIRGAEDIPLRLTFYSFFYPDSSSPPDLFPTLRILASSTSLVPWLFFVAGIVGALSLLRSAAWPVTIMLGMAVAEYSPIDQYIDYRLVLAVFPFLCLAVLETARLTRQWWHPAVRSLAALYRQQRASEAAT